MDLIKGVSASKGIAKGKVHIKKLKELNEIEYRKIASHKTSHELERLNKAIEMSKSGLKKIKEKTEIEAGKEEAEIFKAHLMFLDDPEFVGAMKKKISKENFTAESSVRKIMQKYLSIFENMDNEYMKARKADVKDVSRRIIDNLNDNEEKDTNLNEGTVLIASDLTPSMTGSLDKDKIVAFVTAAGSRTSHTAIIARSLGIPAVVGAGEKIMSLVEENAPIIVDGIEGKIIVKPDKSLSEKYERKKADYVKKLSLLKKYKDKKAVTKDGEEIEIAANIGKINDVADALENGAEGIGLFRTEFLYMDRDSLPDEDEQFEVYKEVAEKMEDKPVIIRTLDAGGDKDISYLDLAGEMNPFLGYRAIRLCLDRKEEIFKPQLKAILRASNYGNVKMMYPFICSYEEVIEANEILEEAKEDLREDGFKFDENMEVGIMIETPAAVMIAARLARMVDFFSIGTNDLIQYTIAVDRTNEKINKLHNPYHPGVLKLIKNIIEKAHQENIWVGMCGAAAANVLLLPFFLGAGLDEFSMSPNYISEIKEKLENWSRKEAEEEVEKVLKFNSAEEIKVYLKNLSN